MICLLSFVWALGLGIARADGFGPETFSLEGSWPGYPRGPVVAVGLQGSYAYCALAEAGLAVVDLAAEEESQVIGRLEFPGGCHDVVVNGTLGYLALGSAGLGIADFSVPATPRLLQVVPLPGFAAELALEGSLLGVVTGHGRSLVYFLDVSDPFLPRTMSSYDALSAIHRLVLVPGRLYLATGLSGMQIVDVSQPEAPALLGGFHIPNRSVGSLAVVDRHAFVLLRGLGVSIVDISNPESPKEAERISLNSVETLSLVGSRLVVWDSRLGMVCFDIGTPVQPLEIGRLEIKAASLGSVARPAVDQERLWFPAREQGLVGVRLGGPDGLRLERTVALDVGQPVDLAVEGDRVFVADGPGGLAVLGETEPGGLQLLGRFQSQSSVDAVSVSNGRVAIVSLGQVTFLDVRDPSQISVLGEPVANGIFPFWQYGVALGPEHAYLGGFGLGVAHLKDLPHCPVTNIIGSEHRIRSVVIRDQHLFACTDGAIWIFDLEDPGHPRLIGQHRAPNWGRTWGFNSLGFVGSLGFAATDTFGLEAVDLRDLEFPRSLGNSLLWRGFGPIVPHGAWGLGAVDGVLSLLDLSNPGAVEVSTPNPEATVTGSFRVVGNRLLVADGARGVTIRRLPSVPPVFLRMPSDRNIIPAGGVLTLEVEISGTTPLSFQWMRDGFVLPGRNTASLRLEDADPSSEGNYTVIVSNVVGAVTSPEFQVRRRWPASVVEVGRLPGPVRAIEIDGDRAYACLGEEGIAYLDLRQPTAPVERWRKRFDWVVTDVRLRGDLAYVAGGERGFSILEAESGEVIGNAEAFAPLTLEVFGDRAYVATETTGLLTIDIADPRNPQTLGQWTTTWVPLKLARRGRQLFGVADHLGIFVFDLEDAQPLNSPVFAPVGGSANVACGADWAIIVDRGLVEYWPFYRELAPALHALDIRNPESPRSLGRRPFSGDVQALTMAGDWLYAATTNGLVVLDYSDPSTPVIVSQWQRAWQPLDLAVHRNRLWVADAVEGILVLEIRVATTPRLVLARRADETIELRWPSGTGAVLEESPGLTPPVWTSIPETVLTDSWKPSINASNSFFRLAVD